MQKTQTNWVFLTWSLCFIALSFVTIVLWFLCFSFLSLGFALHYIHAFHSRCFLFNIKIQKEGKWKHIIVLALFSLFLKTRLVNLFSHGISFCTLFSFDELIYYTLLVKALLNMLCGKDVYGVYHFVLILKSHVFDCRTWSFWERYK